MKKYTKVYIALLLALLMLVSCSNPADGISKPTVGTSDPAGDPSASTGNAQKPVMDNHELIVPIVEECRVSSQRTGARRQGIDALDNGFEVTDTGAYWMYDHWLLYGDHGSDTIIKLCGRPDCTHSDEDCNAYFGGCNNICYYGGYLYTFGYDGLYRINLDGSKRLLVFNLPDFKMDLRENYRGKFAPEIRNGVLSFDLTKLDESGNQIGTSFYYKLDGSMESPKQTAPMVYRTDTDGDTFCGIIGFDDEGEEREYIYGIWDPDTNMTTEFFQTTTRYSSGYIGSKAIYYIENGVVYEYTYATGTTSALFDTGLEGMYRVSCFPDIIVVSEYSEGPQDAEGSVLYFYDWNFQKLGSLRIDYSGRVLNFICGETHERIMLADSLDSIPRYYIDKSDFGTGNITIHEYEWDFEWE